MMHFWRQSGVTLLELIITLSIVALLITLAIPGIQKTVAENRIAAMTDLLIRTTHLARSEAIRRGNRVVTCLSDETQTCNAGNLDRLLVFSDPDRTGSPTDPLHIIKTVEFDANLVTLGYNRPFLAFTATGYASGTNGTFKVCEYSGEGDFVIVSTLGRARKGRDYDGDGVVEKPEGTPIDC